MNRFFLCFIFTIISVCIHAETVSVIIPCYWKHFNFLENLLKKYEEQTLVPNEIVISLSEAKKVDRKAIKKLRNRKYLFKLKVITNDGILSPGMNRNIACDNSKGAILVCQDADDLPHPQRLEIIHHIFTHNDCLHLLHGFITDPILYPNVRMRYFGPYETSTVKICPMRQWYKIRLPSANVTHGNIAIRRVVFEHFRWNDLFKGEDHDYNFEVLNALNSSYVIDANLLMYRRQYSSPKSVLR